MLESLGHIFIGQLNLTMKILVLTMYLKKDKIMDTEFYSQVIGLFKDATKQLDTLSSSANSNSLSAIENIKSDLHAYSTEVAMFFVAANKEGLAMTQTKYNEILKKVGELLSRAKTRLA